MRELASLTPGFAEMWQDGTNWERIEGLIADQDLVDAFLRFVGLTLAERWAASPRPLFASRANAWLRSHWSDHWDELTDKRKRWLVDAFAQEASTAQAFADGARQTLASLRDVMK